MNLRKPLFWNNKNLISISLIPFSSITFIVNFFKNFFLKKNYKIKTICIGNIYLGGTGKTSLSIQISKILNEKNIKTCFVKKFHSDQADEQKLLEKKGKLFLGKTRLEAIKKAEKENYKIAILDDGLQDSSIKYDVNFVCSS